MVISDATAGDIAEWDAIAATTTVEIVSVDFRQDSTADTTVSIQDIANNWLLQEMPLGPTQTTPISISYEAGARPRLRGLTIDTPAGTSGLNIISYSVVCRIVS